MAASLDEYIGAYGNDSSTVHTIDLMLDTEDAIRIANFASDEQFDWTNSSANVPLTGFRDRGEVYRQLLEAEAAGRCVLSDEARGHMVKLLKYNDSRF